MQGSRFSSTRRANTFHKHISYIEPSDEPSRWSGELPPHGPYAFVDYAIVVRGTRGNATYKLTVTIR
jgi:hypothetical protein